MLKGILRQIDRYIGKQAERQTDRQNDILRTGYRDRSTQGAPVNHLGDYSRHLQPGETPHHLGAHMEAQEGSCTSMARMRQGVSGSVLSF